MKLISYFVAALLTLFVSTVAQAQTTGDLRMLVVRAYWDGQAQPTMNVEGEVARLRTFVLGRSEGQATLTPTFTPWLQLDIPFTCDRTVTRAAIRRQMLAASVSSVGYRFEVLFIDANCGQSEAQLGGLTALVRRLSTLSHELLHLFGFAHPPGYNNVEYLDWRNGVYASAKVQPTKTSVADDAFEGEFGTYGLMFLGWAGDNHPTVHTKFVTSAGRYDLNDSTRAALTGGFKGLHLSLTDSVSALPFSTLYVTNVRGVVSLRAGKFGDYSNAVVQALDIDPSATFTRAFAVGQRVCVRRQRTAEITLVSVDPLTKRAVLDINPDSPGCVATAITPAPLPQPTTPPTK